MKYFRYGNVDRTPRPPSSASLFKKKNEKEIKFQP